jgi:hypothetical protein
MLNSYWLSAPFVLQMFCIAADEFWFHRRRGLPRWERIGHPLDTLTVVLCLAWVLCVQPNRRTVVVYIALAVFSSVFVTKDEPVHQRHCTAAEHWIHAILFLLHPVVLAGAALLWPAAGSRSPGASLWVVQFSGFERPFLIVACALMIGFGIYQFVFWNLLWHPRETARKIL